MLRTEAKAKLFKHPWAVFEWLRLGYKAHCDTEASAAAAVVVVPGEK